MADDMVASNAVKVGQWDSQLCEGKFGEILNCYKVSTMGDWEETKKLVWVQERVHKSSKGVYRKKDLHSSNISR